MSTQNGAVRSTMAGRVSEMTHVVGIKQGLTVKIGVVDGILDVDEAAPPVRWADNLRFVFELIALDTAAGQLTPLNDVATIHFARWVILPGDQQLLFTSNFDGGWEQYIHDFVTIANSGVKTPHNTTGARWMDAIWGNCIGYPGTDDFPAFLDFISTNMVQTTLWYPTITDVTVRDTSWLRQFRNLFATFEEAAFEVDRSAWPPRLLEAYDTFTRAVNRIDVTDV